MFAMQNIWRLIGVFQIERVCDFGTSFERVDWIAGISTEPGGLHPTFLLSRAARQSA